MKGNNCSYKLRYKKYRKLIYRCLLDDMYTKLTHMINPYGEITCVYEKAHMTVVQVIFRLDVTKLSYIESVIF